MPSCGACGKRWPDEFRVCPDDGTSLVISGANVAGYAATAPSMSGSVVADVRDRDDDLAPGSMAGEYQIEAKIGQGGMGSVYGARHPLIGKRAAIKVISSELSASQTAVDRFVLEAQAVNQIGHPNIVDVFGFGRLPDGRSFFVMEWLHGESLRKRLERPMPFAEAVDILDSVTQALQAAHEAGVVHRDLKPDNVFLADLKGAKPLVKLLDFGLAKLSSPTGQADGRLERTRTGVVMGTPLYLSPEQAKGAKIDAATDIYSLGVMAYEMFSGRVPFLADSAVEIMSMHITTAPQAPSSIAHTLPPAVDALLLAMMAKEAGQRPTASQIREQLAALRSFTNVATVGAAPSPGQWPAATPAPVSVAPLAPAAAAAPTIIAAPKRRRGLIAVLALVGMGAAGAGGYALFVGGSRPKHAKHRDAGQVAQIDVVADAKPAVVAVAPVDAKLAEPVPIDAKPATKPIATKPKPPEKPKTATIVIKIEGVSQGEVNIDGDKGEIAVTERTAELTPGDHKIVVRSLKAQTPVAKTIHVEAGANQTITITLKPKRRATARDPYPNE